MSDLWCKTCGKFKSSAGHTCPPKWQVWGEDLGGRDRDDALEVFAVDAEYAAQDAAEIDDAGGDYSIVSGSEVRVFVAKEGSDKIQQFIVSGESVPQYNANEISSEDIKLIDKMEKEGFRYDAHWGSFRGMNCQIKERELKKQLNEGKSLLEIIRGMPK